LARDGAVEQRPVGVVEEPVVIRFRDPVREQVGVVTGQADHRQHLARLRIDDNRRARGLSIATQAGRKGLGGCLLQR